MGMLKSATRSDVKRKTMDISDECNSILMADPYLISFVYERKHYETLPEDDDIIACTDGLVVEYGPKYRSLPLPERAYVCVHEIGHGVGLHSMRAVLWMMCNGYLFPGLWNYAADVVINEGISNNPMMRNGFFREPGVFPPCRMETTIHQSIAEVVRITGETPPSDYRRDMKRDLRVETLYEWLVWGLFAMRRHRGQHPMTGKSEGGGGDSSPGDSTTSGKLGEGSPGDADEAREEGAGTPADAQEAEKDDAPDTAIERMERDTGWDLRDAVDEVQRRLDEGETPDEIVREMEARIEEARGKIMAAVADAHVTGGERGQGSLVMSLSRDLPKPVVPWNRIIRKVVDGALGVNMQKSHNRPGNATLCAMALGRRSLPVSRGVTIFSPRARILVGLDVSGSMRSEILRCCSEIWSMAQIKNAEIDLVTWDDGIQESFTIKDRRDFERILDRGLRGNGSTTLMQEVFDYADRGGHQAIIIMTDGYVNVALPRKPRIPVIWAVTPGGATAGLEEYGTVVRIAPQARAAIGQLAMSMAA